jgi:hypothetical protein
MEFSFDFAIPRDLAILVTLVGGFAACFKGLVEYVKQGAEKRANRFFQLEKEFLGDASFVRIIECLDVKSADLATIAYQEKVRFVGFFEKLALLQNSGLILPQVASYVYGYYVILCARSDDFWSSEMDRSSPYWVLFFDFASKMERLPPTSFSPGRLKF